ncbi:MAG: L-seryl-tRNA(Sec) selenium transferase [Candidatus Delongbacteria bacterium]|nr:L-seryl-tRNA(Sec) selenium transferase [Candidatus Delongbacteria bacterium]MCG2760521.1 L-seryl-tRNA(Sec) selenium transferase [Candidatus Delongbacteria bacterium]
MNEILKKIPKVDKILNDDIFSDFKKIYKNEIIVKIIQNELEKLRNGIIGGKVKDIPAGLIKNIANEIENKFRPFIKRVVNGTGIVLNTGLGRAPLSENAVKNAENILYGYCSLEVDIQSGKRGRREDKISELISIITGAEAATVVNNNAAAVMICINTLAQKKEIIISRGELVEIGGSFRMPDIIKKSGAKMIEVGATNKTKLSDYEEAISSKTGALLKVHTSNYRINGFVEEVTVKDLYRLADKYNLPVYYDLGGGIFDDLEKYGLPHEPTVYEAVNEGVHIFSFSGDKVLGGPQCGIIAGKKEFVEKVKKNPLMRVLRTDKIRLALLEETLRYFLTDDPINNGHLTLKMLSEKMGELKVKAEKLKSLILNSIPKSWNVCIEEIDDQAGSGTLPTEKLEGIGLSFAQKDLTPNKLSDEMRTITDTPVFGFINDDKYYLSVRTIFNRDYKDICVSFKKIMQKYNLE